MFKKSLLALSVAALSSTAMAGTIYSSAVNTPVADLASPAPGFGTQCVDLGAVSAGDTAADDTLTDANVAGIFVGAATKATSTGNETCTVITKTTVSNSTAKSPVEQTGAILVGADIVAGAGGYREEDTITIEFAGAKIKTAVIPTLVTLAAAGAPKFDLLDITDTTVRFTVRSAAGDVPAAAILNLAGVSLDTTGLTTGTKVSINTFATNTSGTKYDVIDATEIHELVPQYTATVAHKLNGVIDVQSERKVLVNEAAVTTPAHDDTVLTDTLFVKVARDTTVNHVDSTTVTFALEGDFAWLSTAADATVGGTTATAAEILAYLNAGGGSLSVDNGANYTGVTSAVLNAAMDTLTITETTATTNAAADYAIKLTVPAQAAANAQVLATQTYKVSVSSTDGVAAPNTISMTAGTDLAAGAWTLNGSVVTIPYMPFDDNTAVIMRHTNTGVQTGDMSVRYMLEGVSLDWEEAGVIGSSSRGVQNIRDLVINKIKDAANVVGGKVAIEITTNVPKDDVTVYAGFRVKDENDRGFVGTYGKRGSTAAN